MKIPEVIAIDLDGTLLNSNYEISNRNLNVLRKVAQLGIKIIPATGRRFSSAIGFVEKIPSDSFSILQNGAVIIEKKSREIFYYSTIERDLLEAICDFNRRENLYPIYISSPFNGSKLYLNSRTHKYLRLERYLVKQRGDVEVFFSDRVLKRIDITQLMYFGSVKEVEKLFKKLESKFGDSLSMTLTVYEKRDLSILDVMRRGISKGIGLKMIAKYFGVEKDGIWAIGDNINDIEMFKVASFSMAMENGCDKVKKSASVIIPGNDEDGVSLGLEKFLFGGGKNG